jgi:hypothetical protein
MYQNERLLSWTKRVILLLLFKESWENKDKILISRALSFKEEETHQIFTFQTK